MPLADSQRFLIKRWPEGLVVFDRQLGDTHAMGEPTASLFEAWLEQPEAELAQLAASLPADEAVRTAAVQELQRLFPGS
ncbi:hypothetical protein [Inhella proteolytica]|uniref:Uncharacterized protein n=1 Tax=Inhella proteolytica TaxID=2795029 RepID=A0A931J4G2_9BURK|nr:hypothetical protein [Inhella proteolytica]MBH9577364.1 hypothetical protein [Inhella proteolytica]